MSAKIGRNDPCPCGSGKKAKHCHGVEQAPVEAVDTEPRAAVAKAFDWLEQRHLKAVRESFAEFVFNDLWPEEGPAPEEVDQRLLEDLMGKLQEVWFASGEIRLGTRHHRVIELVRGALGARLSPGELAFLNELAANRHRLYRVLERAPDGACMLMDALDLAAEPFRFDGSDLAGRLAPGTLVGLRLLTVDGRRESSGVWFEFPLSSDIRVLNFVTEVAAADYEEEDDRGFAAEAEIVTCWIEAILGAQQSVAAANDGKDGDDEEDESWDEDDDGILSITDHYQVLDDAGLARILDACPLLDSSSSAGWLMMDLEADDPVFHLEIRRGSAPDRLEVDYGTREDAEHWRPWFEELVGDAVRYLNREASDPFESLDEDLLAQLGDLPPEVMQRLALGIRPEFEPEWLDEPLLELDWETPRSAAKSKSGAAKLRQLLLDLEAEEAEFARENDVQPLPLEFLWAQLGLTR